MKLVALIIFSSWSLHFELGDGTASISTIKATSGSKWQSSSAAVIPVATRKKSIRLKKREQQQ